MANKFLENLGTLLAETGMTKEQLEQAAALPRNRVSKWAEDADPKGSHLARVARVFDVSVDWLLGLTERRTPTRDGWEDELLKLIRRLGMPEDEAFQAIAKWYREQGGVEAEPVTDQKRRAL